MSPSATIVLVVELLVLFFSVSFGIELISRRVGTDRLRAWMGGRPVTAALKGIAVGFVTPFCTYSAIPMLVGLRQAAVPPAGYVAFIVAAPVLDPILFGALVIIVGPLVAAVYVAVAFTAAMTLALFAQHRGIEHHLRPVSNLTRPALARVMATSEADPPGVATAGAVEAHEPGCASSSWCRPEAPWEGIAVESRQAASASVRLLRSLGPLLFVGVGIGLAIEAFVSPEAAADVTGASAGLSIPVAAALGTPLYFHTELFVPIADSLSDAGVGIGTIVALTISGAGANVPEMVILSRLARMRVIVAFFGYVFAVAIIGGLIAQALT